MMGKSMMFCPECNNMLYPREDKEKRQLQFLCRQCDYSRYPKKTDTAQHIVERTNFNFKSKEDIVISSDLSKDPTLGRVFDWRCPRCRGMGGVFYQLPERVAEDAMTLVYVCTQPSCGAWEIQQPDGQGTGEDGRREKEEDSPASARELRGASFRLQEAKVEEDASSVAGVLEAGALSVKRPVAETQDESREAGFGDAPLGGEVEEEDDDLFGEREEEEILESQDAFDEDDPYTHRLEPQDGCVGELDVTFD